jgi:hypothetical protein
VSDENVLKIECNITETVGFMQSGIMEVGIFRTPISAGPHVLVQALNQTVVKQSPTLGREATYNSKSRLSRLPSYLAIHMVRFTWRREIGKKAKIMVSTLPYIFNYLVASIEHCVEKSEISHRVRRTRHCYRRAPGKDAAHREKTD